MYLKAELASGWGIRDRDFLFWARSKNPENFYHRDSGFFTFGISLGSGFFRGMGYPDKKLTLLRSIFFYWNLISPLYSGLEAKKFVSSYMLILDRLSRNLKKIAYDFECVGYPRNFLFIKFNLWWFSNRIINRNVLLFLECILFHIFGNNNSKRKFDCTCKVLEGRFILWSGDCMTVPGEIRFPAPTKMLRICNCHFPTNPTILF